jgi:oxygen-dependent protoporphyrinogen oxidase
VISTGNENVVVVGGGISGLASAYYLLQSGFHPLLIEQSGRFGGLIKTDRIEGCDLEAGPDSFIASKPAVAELARSLGIETQIIGSNDAARRIFIVKGGQLKPMPPGMVFMAPGDLDAALNSDFFSSETKARFRDELHFRPLDRKTDVSVREFVTDHFGEDILETLTEPLLSGVYGGDAGSLSAASVLPRFVEYERDFGSIIRGVQQERAARKGSAGALFLSFSGGMETLTDALGREVLARIRTANAEALSIERAGAQWRIYTSAGQIEAEDVVLACPAHVSARLLNKSCPDLATELAAIPYSSAVLVTFVYRREELGRPLDGFGFLVPRRERQSIAAATWVSTKFPCRTPENLAALRAFIVGDEAIKWMERPEDELVASVRQDYSRLMGINATPHFSTVYRWPDSMPQYTVGHGVRQSAMRALLAGTPGLHLTGNAYDGVGIPDCVRLASQIPDRILARSSHTSQRL